MSQLIKFAKVVSALPGTLESNTIYFVRSGAGTLAYITNDLGLVVAYPLIVDLSGKADLVHTHAGEDITSGTVSADFLPDASLLAPGIVQLSSDINSTSETIAATSAAVKAVHDLISASQQGLGDNNSASNADMKAIQRIKSSALYSLDFINYDYKVNSGNGLIPGSLSQILVAWRSMIKETVDNLDVVNDGCASFHLAGINNCIFATDIYPVATSFSPIDYALGGAYQYRGQWAHRLELRNSADLSGSIAVTGASGRSGGLLIEPNRANLISDPDTNGIGYTAVNGTFGFIQFDRVMNGSSNQIANDLVPSMMNNYNIRTFILTESTATGRHYATCNSSSAVVSGEMYTWSVYFNSGCTAGETFFLELGGAFPANAHCSFVKTVLDGKTTYAASGMGSGCIDYSIELVNSEFIRVSITAEASSSAVANLIIGSGLATASFAGTERELIFFGEQFEQSRYPTSTIFPWDETLNTRGSDVYKIPFVGDIQIYHDDFSKFERRQEITYNSSWFVMHIDHLVLGHIHTLMAFEYTGNSTEPVVLTAEITSATEIDFTLTLTNGTPNVIITETATIDYSKPFTVAVGILVADYINTIKVLVHQQGANDTAVQEIISTTGTVGGEMYIDSVDSVLVGSKSGISGTNTNSANINDTMWGHVRNFEIYPGAVVSAADIEIVMKSYDL